MATGAKRQGDARLIERIDHAEQASLEAVRKFLDTVDEAFPHLSSDKPRRKIIDSAFKMTEQLVGASTQLAQNVLDMTQKVMSDANRRSAAPSKKAAAPARTAKATKSAAKTTKKAPTKSTR